MRAKLVNESNIFSGAVWSDGEDYMVLSELTPSGEHKIYGKGYDFDFVRDTKEEAEAQLKKWGYHYIGID